MAYDSRNLYTMAYGGGFTLWYYGCTDALQEVTEPGYFAAAGRLLRSGDRLIVNCQPDTQLTAQDFVVSNQPDAVVRLLPIAGARTVSQRRDPDDGSRPPVAAVSPAAPLAAGGK